MAAEPGALLPPNPGAADHAAVSTPCFDSSMSISRARVPSLGRKLQFC